MTLSTVASEILVGCTSVFVVAVAGACRPDLGPSEFQQTDSSGVTIAESSAAAWLTQSGWTLSDEPTVQIGVEDGDAMYQFFRVSAARWISGYRLVVANSGSNTIRFFDLEGDFVKEVGGEGDGPGEFRRVYSLERYGVDSLVAFDASLRRLSIFTTEGEFARSVQLQQPGPEPIYGAYPLTDGGFVLRTVWSSAMMGRDMTPGVHRSPQPLFRYSADGALVDTVGVFPGYDIYVTGSAAGGDLSMGIAPYGRITAIDVRRDRVYVGTGDKCEIQVYSPEGDLQRLIRWPDYPRRIGQEDIDSFREQVLGFSDDPAARRMLSND